jgi:hypothetical protein
MVQEVKPLEICEVAPCTAEVIEPSEIVTVPAQEVTSEETTVAPSEYKLIDTFHGLQKEYKALANDEEKTKWIQYQKDSTEVFKSLGLVGNKEDNKNNPLVVNDINSADRVFITNADNTLEHIIAVKEAESKGLSKSFTIFAIIWAVCGTLMCIGGQLFYKKDILKLQQNEK